MELIWSESMCPLVAEYKKKFLGSEKHDGLPMSFADYLNELRAYGCVELSLDEKLDSSHFSVACSLIEQVNIKIFEQQEKKWRLYSPNRDCRVYSPAKIVLYFVLCNETLLIPDKYQMEIFYIGGLNEMFGGDDDNIFMFSKMFRESWRQSFDWGPIIDNKQTSTDVDTIICTGTPDSGQGKYKLNNYYFPNLIITKLQNKIDSSTVEIMAEKFDDPVLVAEILSSDNGW
jgi:hypothetical protein